VDLTRQKLDADVVREAQLVAIHLPMHTATRLAGPIILKIRDLNPSARICAYGLYAPLNREWLQAMGVTDVLGGEFEHDLAALARGVAPAAAATDPRSGAVLPKLQFLTPDRSGLPALAQYATLQRADGTRGVTGYTEASRGCRHLCRHCPIVPVYEGQFRVVQPDVVLADIAAQVAAGAAHITFGDPDFFNGPSHATRIVRELHRAHPHVTYDVTIKVEHLLQHMDLLPQLRETGCLFVTSAVESVDDRVLALLAKGHTRADFLRAVAACRNAGLTIVPTFVAFHPWLTIDGYLELLDTIDGLDLVDHVAPIQLAIRLLIPSGSKLLELPEVREHVDAFDPVTLTHRWKHADVDVDRLHHDVTAIVGARLTSHRRDGFEAIHAAASARAGRTARPGVSSRPARARATVPYLNEPWYC
jgi:radical SAM superfamily enzyme YgiQ (UPF0313 family)